MKVMPPVLVSICVNVLAAAGCVKFSEVLVSLAFTINTESVLNLRTGDRAVVYCTRAMYALALFCSVYVLQRRSPVCAW